MLTHCYGSSEYVAVDLNTVAQELVDGLRPLGLSYLLSRRSLHPSPLALCPASRILAPSGRVYSVIQRFWLCVGALATVVLADLCRWCRRRERVEVEIAAERPSPLHVVHQNVTCHCSADVAQIGRVLAPSEGEQSWGEVSVVLSPYLRQVPYVNFNGGRYAWSVQDWT